MCLSLDFFPSNRKFCFLFFYIFLVLVFIFDHDPFQILLGCDLHFPPLLLLVNPQVFFQEPVDSRRRKNKKKNPEYGPTALRFILQRPNTFNLDSLGP
jgi:hypothetical protein